MTAWSKSGISFKGIVFYEINRCLREDKIDYVLPHEILNTSISGNKYSAIKGMSMDVIVVSFHERIPGSIGLQLQDVMVWRVFRQKKLQEK